MSTPGEPGLSVPGEHGLRGLPFVLLTLAFGALVLRDAWLCDDAYITFRTVDNLVAGEGPRWNLAERVQSYTHPLWMLLLAAARAATGELYGASLALSLATSLAAFALVIRSAARTPLAAVAAAAVLLGSKAFVDYSTSGLEGPLVHLLIAVLLLGFVGRGPERAFLLSCATALLLVTRPDALPLVAPLAAAGLYGERRRWPALLAGAVPLAAWLGFSLLYYGFPFPNTAYAKLSSGLPREWLFVQGLHYLLNSVRLDPLTLIAITLGLAAALWKRDRASLLLAAGVLLQLGYVVWIGGDFMSGRFLTPPLLAAALILARCATGAALALPLAAFLGALMLATPRSPLRAPTAYGANLDGSVPHDHIDQRGITDERAYWFHYTGLFSPSRLDPTRPHVTRGHPFAARLRAEGSQLHVVNGMGFMGYFAGPAPFLLDPMGLTDPLLARLPIWRRGAFRSAQDVPEGTVIPWRIGHFVRPIPPGYQATLEDGRNELESPALAEYWEVLARITRAPLFAPGRWNAIWRMNLGACDGLLERYLEEEVRE